MAFFVEGITGWVGAIGTVVAIAVTYFVYLRSRRSKILSYEIISDYPLISIADELRGKLKVLYDGNPVENVQLLLIKFINAGNIPITTADFEQPLSIHLGKASTVLSAERVNSSPANLIVNLHLEKEILTFDPALLNAGDFFTTKILIGQYGGSFTVDARIVGVNAIRLVKKPSRFGFEKLWRWKPLPLFLVSALIVAAFILFVQIIFNDEKQTPTITRPAESNTVVSSDGRTFANPELITIPDSGQASPYPSSITVSGLSGTLDKVTVEIDGLSHTYAGDVAMLLMAPNNKCVTLMSDIAPYSTGLVRHDFHGTNLLFDDDAPVSAFFAGGQQNTPPNTPTTIPSGTYRPTNNKRRDRVSFSFPGITNSDSFDNLSVFNGIDPNGMWKLYVYDDYHSDSGAISEGWKLKLRVSRR